MPKPTSLKLSAILAERRDGTTQIIESAVNDRARRAGRMSAALLDYHAKVEAHGTMRPTSANLSQTKDESARRHSIVPRNRP